MMEAFDRTVSNSPRMWWVRRLIAIACVLCRGRGGVGRVGDGAVGGYSALLLAIATQNVRV